TPRKATPMVAEDTLQTDSPARPEPEAQVAMFRDMLRTSVLDARRWALNRQGRAALVVSCRGHEAVQVASARALDPQRDLFFIYYRDLGVCLALGVTPYEVLLGALARAADPFSGGRQFPLHGAYPARPVINPSNVVAGHLTEAAAAGLPAGGLIQPRDVETWPAGAQREVDDATRAAEAAPEPDAATLQDHVYRS